MRVLALDLGRELGWAAWVDGQLSCGMHQLTDAGAGIFKITLAFTHWLNRSLESTKAEAVAYEAPVRQFGKARGSSANQILIALAGIAAGLPQAAGLQVRSYAPATLKARVAGHGRAGKDAVRRATSCLWGDRLARLGLHDPEYPETMDHNMADALAVLLCALWDLDPTWTPAIELKF